MGHERVMLEIEATEACLMMHGGLEALACFDSGIDITKNVAWIVGPHMATLCPVQRHDIAKSKVHSRTLL